MRFFGNRNKAKQILWRSLILGAIAFFIVFIADSFEDPFQIALYRSLALLVVVASARLIFHTIHILRGQPLLVVTRKGVISYAPLGGARTLRWSEIRSVEFRPVPAGFKLSNVLIFRTAKTKLRVSGFFLNESLESVITRAKGLDEFAASLRRFPMPEKGARAKSLALRLIAALFGLVIGTSPIFVRAHYGTAKSEFVHGIKARAGKAFCSPDAELRPCLVESGESCKAGARAASEACLTELAPELPARIHLNDEALARKLIKCQYKHMLSEIPSALQSKNCAALRTAIASEH